MENFKCLGNCQTCEALKNGQVQISCAIMITQSRTFQLTKEIKLLRGVIEQLLNNQNIMALPQMIIEEPQN